MKKSWQQALRLVYPLMHIADVAVIFLSLSRICQDWAVRSFECTCFPRLKQECVDEGFCVFVLSDYECVWACPRALRNWQS